MKKWIIWFNSSARTPPTFRDVYERIAKLADVKQRGVPTRIIESAPSLKLRLDFLREVFGSENTINLEDLERGEVLCLDFSKVPSRDAQDLLVEWLLRKLLSYRVRKGAGRTRFTYLIIDEAHRVAHAIIDKSTGQIVSESIISARMRSFRGTALVIDIEI